MMDKSIQKLGVKEVLMGPINVKVNKTKNSINPDFRCSKISNSPPSRVFHNKVASPVVFQSIIVIIILEFLSKAFTKQIIVVAKTVLLCNISAVQLNLYSKP
jgi:uncharacterized membrane protein